jgi:hypothetical protein
VPEKGLAGGASMILGAFGLSLKTNIAIQHRILPLK